MNNQANEKKHLKPDAFSNKILFEKGGELVTQIFTSSSIMKKILYAALQRMLLFYGYIINGKDEENMMIV